MTSNPHEYVAPDIPEPGGPDDSDDVYQIRFETDLLKKIKKVSRSVLMLPSKAKYAHCTRAVVRDWIRLRERVTDPMARILASLTETDPGYLLRYSRQPPRDPEPTRTSAALPGSAQFESKTSFETGADGSSGSLDTEGAEKASFTKVSLTLSAEETRTLIRIMNLIGWGSLSRPLAIKYAIHEWMDLRTWRTVPTAEIAAELERIRTRKSELSPMTEVVARPDIRAEIGRIIADHHLPSIGKNRWECSTEIATAIIRKALSNLMESSPSYISKHHLDSGTPLLALEMSRASGRATTQDVTMLIYSARSDDGLLIISNRRVSEFYELEMAGVELLTNANRNRSPYGNEALIHESMLVTMNGEDHCTISTDTSDLSQAIIRLRHEQAQASPLRSALPKKTSVHSNIRGHSLPPGNTLGYGDKPLTDPVHYSFLLYNHDFYLKDNAYYWMAGKAESILGANHTFFGGDTHPLIRNGPITRLSTDKLSSWTCVSSDQFDFFSPDSNTKRDQARLITIACEVTGKRATHYGKRWYSRFICWPETPEKEVYIGFFRDTPLAGSRNTFAPGGYGLIAIKASRSANIEDIVKRDAGRDSRSELDILRKAIQNNAEACSYWKDCNLREEAIRSIYNCDA